ncbi:hypothetical protein MPSEU_000978200 [Mayamaea pseudoterrestris]|nr:hypothetical protein MPSEU_000978200 [Mayamaea pseudoterrestris]
MILRQAPTIKSMKKRDRPAARTSVGCLPKVALSFVVLLATACDAFVPMHVEPTLPSLVSSRPTQMSRHKLMVSVGAEAAMAVDTASTSSSSPTTRPAQMELPDIDKLLGRDGIYGLSNPTELKVFLYHFPDRIACIRVHAPWCKTCKSMFPQYRKLAKTLSKQVVFADFNARNNQDFCRNILDVEAFPTILIYKTPNELLSTHPCGPSKMKNVKNALQSYVDDFSRRNDEALKATDSSLARSGRVGGQVASRLHGLWKALF